MTSRRRTKSKRVRVVRRWADLCWQVCLRAFGLCRRAAVRLYQRLWRRRPTVIVDARRRQARRLRRDLARAARTYARALGVELPLGMLIVVQRVVYEGRQLNGLLQAFEGSNGHRRYVLHLALSVNGRSVNEDELLAALRHQLARALEDVIGKPAVNMPLDLEVPRARAGAPVVALQPDGDERRDGQQRRAVPFQRIENDNEAS